MRLFLAIDLPGKIKENLNKQIEKIKKEYPYFNWIPFKNYHITLFFFGEVKESKPIEKKLEEIVFDQKSFCLYSLGADLFINRKIIIYLNFKKEKTLEIIAQRVRQDFEKDKKDLKFVPHLTLARYRIPSKQQYFVLKKRLEKLPIDISFTVKKLILFESILKGKLPQYKKVKEVFLL